MRFRDREYFVSRLLSSYINIKYDDSVLRLYVPTNEIIYEANELVYDCDIDLLTNDDVGDILLERGLWTEDEDLKLNTIIPENLDKLKVGLYESQFQSIKQDRIRQYIKATNEEYYRLYNKRHQYDYITLEGYLSLLKNQFLLEKCMRYHKKRVDWSVFDINIALTYYYRSIISSDLLRELARTTPWSVYWSTRKVKNLFEGYVTSEQQQIVQWSLLYDNARESIDCPADFVFDDDDMFDGWLIVQRKKREAETNKQNVEKKLSNKARGADEIFLPADTIDDAERIMSLNNPHMAAIQKSRMKQIKRSGIVKESDLLDVKQDLLIRQNQTQVSKIKGA